MLTATYSIVTIKLEHKKARWTFSSIQQAIMNSIRNIKNASGMDVENILERLSQFEHYCHQRKMEVFVIPAVRRFTHEADSLIDELESLSASSLAILHSLQSKLRDAVRIGALVIEDFCASLEQCCAHLFHRLTREEELVHIAERFIPNEAWFGIAASFLSQDAARDKQFGTASFEEEE